MSNDVCPACPVRQQLAALQTARGDFVNIASHELRTPLAVINGYTSMLETTLTGSEDVLDLLAGLQAGVNRLSRIVEALLLAGQIAAGELKPERQPYPVATLMKQAISTWAEAIAGRKLRVELVVEREGQDISDRSGDLLWPVEPTFMELALHHLIQNAIKFTPDGGRISCRVSGTGHELRLEVVDSGVGIRAGHQRAIFEPFFRGEDSRLHSTGDTKFMGAGPGLGLYLVRGIVEAHGGRVWVEAGDEGQGSKFVIGLAKKGSG